MFRKLFIAVLLLLAIGRANAGTGDSSVSIMTQNMDQGTGLGYIVAAAFGQGTVADAVDLTFAELQASHLSARAELIATKIAEQKPDLVALQEVTLWRIGPDPAHANRPVYDQLAYILKDLMKLRVPYGVVAVNKVDDIALAGNQVHALRITSSNVLLVRMAFRWPVLYFSDVQSHIFSTPLAIGDLTSNSGWISAKVHVGRKEFLLATVHLASTIPGYPPATDVQVSQAQELLATLQNSSVPVVICGDFNSDANEDPTVLDYTPTAGMIRDAGYTEVWGQLHGGDLGNTWPLYLDDLVPISFPVTIPFERIDLFFTHGLSALSIDQVVAPGPEGATPPFGSDHAGVIAVVQP
ncbi:MAG: endonuclease/exonuclease/phosphatase family protein [Bryobacteraceae bacterium]